MSKRWMSALKLLRANALYWVFLPTNYEKICKMKTADKLFQIKKNSRTILSQNQNKQYKNLIPLQSGM